MPLLGDGDHEYAVELIPSHSEDLGEGFIMEASAAMFTLSVDVSQLNVGPCYLPTILTISNDYSHRPVART